MSRVEGTFHLNDFQLDSPWGEDDKFFLFLWGEGMALELEDLIVDDLEFLVGQIEDGLRLSEKERAESEIDQLLYRPPGPEPNRLRFCFDELRGLQALYQPPDRLWQMVFEDQDGSQCHVMMSTPQVLSLLETLKEKGRQ